MNSLLRIMIALALVLWILPKVFDLSGDSNSDGSSALPDQRAERGRDDFSEPRPDASNAEILIGRLAELQARKLTDSNEQAARDYESGLESSSNKLLESLSGLSIHDAALKRCIKNELTHMYGGELKHANQLSILLCDRMGISSLSGIGQMRNLKTLSLRGNNITSVSELARLDELKSLDLYGNPDIRDFTSLSTAPKLQQLSVSNLSGTFCYKVEEVFEKVKKNKLNGKKPSLASSFYQQNALPGVECRGAETFDVALLREKKKRRERLTADERLKLRDYEFDQRMR